MIVKASWAGTALLAVTSALAVASSASAVRTVALVVDLALFVGGAVTFLWAYAIAVGRSRSVEIGIGGLYFLQGSAPKPVQRHLLGSLAVEVVIAIATAAAKPFTSVAFAVLAPMWGLGLAGLWAAKHGNFATRTDRVA